MSKITTMLVGVQLLCALPAFAQTPTSLVAASNGAVPGGAIHVGNEADGRALFACVASHEGSRQVGKVGAGYAGCVFAFGGKELVASTYQVVVATAPPVTPPVGGRRGDLIATQPGLVTGRTGTVPPAVVVQPPVSVVDPRRPPLGAVVDPNISVAGVVTGRPAIKRGFDANGDPYIEQRSSDGTVKRINQRGTTITKPDGTSQFQPLMTTRSNVQPPTPPALPVDPAPGRSWLDRQNESLLDVIRVLVDFDDAEITKFKVGEHTATNDDVFKQMAYRAQIAFFLAKEQ